MSNSIRPIDHILVIYRQTPAKSEPINTSLSAVSLKSLAIERGKANIATPYQHDQNPSCTPANGALILIMMLAALGGMVAGWAAWLSKVECSRTTRTLFLALAIVGCAGTIAATKSLNSITGR